MTVCGSMSVLPKREISDTHSLNCSSKLLVTAHAQNKYSTDSFSVSHKEHKGLSTVLNLKSFSFKCKILFEILYWNESRDNSIVAFQLYFSFKLNLEKSEACWIGDRTGSDERPINCKWVNIKCSAIRALGIFNSYDNDLEQKLNILDNIKTLNDVLKLWEFRGLTLAGRILVFKSLALTKLLYAFTMKVPSKFVIDQLNTLHKNFIWNNKRPNIRHSTLIAGYCEGGYKDVDVENKIVAVKIKWVTKLLDSDFHPWKIISN